jgi:opacity protein-like surface antigen
MNAQNYTYVGIHSGLIIPNEIRNSSSPHLMYGLSVNPSQDKNLKIHIEFNFANLRDETGQIFLFQFNPFIKWQTTRFKLKPYLMLGPGLTLFNYSYQDAVRESMSLNAAIGCYYAIGVNLGLNLSYEYQNSDWANGDFLTSSFQIWSLGIQYKI